MELSLFKILAAPITFPYNSFMFITRTIKREVEKELINKDNIKDKILEIEYLYEMGEISEKDYRDTHQYLIEYYRKLQEEELENI